MVDLERQLLEYGRFHEEDQGAITPSEIPGYETEQPDPVVYIPERKPWWQNLDMTKFWMGVAAAAVLVLLLGVIPLWLGSGRSDPAEEPVVDTTKPVETELTEPELEPEPEPAIIEDTDLDSSVTNLGTLSWTRVSGDELTIPSWGIETDDEGGYTAESDDAGWHSDDALVWIRTALDMPDDGSTFNSEEGWGISYPNDPFPYGGATLYEEVEGEWVEVILPDPVLPRVEGIDWHYSPSFPIESGSLTLVHATALGQVPWEDYYGTFTFECGMTDPCEGPPHVFWDDFADAFRVDSPDTGLAIAGLTMVVEDTRLLFSDVDSGETVHTISAETGSQAVEYAEQMKRTGYLVDSVVWIRDEAGDFAYQDVPWVTHFSMPVAVETGGFAVFAFEFDWSKPEDPLESATSWISADGVEWSNHGTPSFVPDGRVEHIDVLDRTGTLTATVITGFDESTGMDTFDSWTSSDGVIWERQETMFPSHTDISQTDFGFVATAMPQSRHLFWISEDGENWEEVEGPPGPHEPNGAGYSDAGAAGDILWVTVGEDSGSRTLWIGRFED